MADDSAFQAEAPRGLPTPEPWPPDYKAEFAKRIKRLKSLRANPKGAKEYYRTRPAEFIEHWGMTYDPRNAKDPDKISNMPFVPFERQREFIQFLIGCLDEEADGLVEKCRDMGATWICVALSVWLLLFVDGSAVGWGSRKKELVDRLGDASSIFEKIRIFIRKLPREFLPEGFDYKEHMTFMKVINPETGSSITGEIGDEIGRGGRTTVYFKDESAHYEHPDLIEASLGDNTNVQIDISSVNGLGNVFYRRRKAGKVWGPGEPMAKDRANVFIMDWRDHPAKTQEWYDRRKAKAEREGLYHKFAQEVERNYAASVTGTIIPLQWIQAAVDAHRILGIPDDIAERGPWMGALDVADNQSGEGDLNAMILRKGIVLKWADQWGERDTGVTTRRAIATLRDIVDGPISLQYDSIGVGSGVKSEYNRLRDEQEQGRVKLPRGLRLVAWDAGRAPLNPKSRMLRLANGEPDPESLKNMDFYQNIKAQGWWELRGRFERTYRALNEPGFTWSVEDLISLSSDIPKHVLYQLQEELGQPTYKQSASLLMMVNKTPEGTNSPNLGDSTMMCFWPMPANEQPTAAFGFYGAAA